MKRFLMIFILLGSPAMAQDIAFGDDASEWANDGICNDIRFYGPGAADILLSEGAGRDATDCLGLCEDGAILLRDY